MLSAEYYIYDADPAAFVRDAYDELQALRAAVEALANNPGTPHAAAAEALKILNRES